MSPNYDLGAGQLGHGDDTDQYEPKQVRVHAVPCSSRTCSNRPLTGLHLRLLLLPCTLQHEHW